MSEDQPESSKKSVSRNEIITLGVISSIIATFVYPFFVNYISALFSWILNDLVFRVYSKLVDRIYERAAVDPFPQETQIFWLSVMTMLFGLMALHILDRGIQVLGRYQYRGQKEVKIYRIYKKTRFFMVFLVMFPTIIFAVLENLSATITQNAYRKIERETKMIYFYASDQEYRSLISRWASIESREDYYKLNDTLTELFKKYHVMLPGQRP